MEPTVRVRARGTAVELEVVSRHVEWYTELGYEPISAALFRGAARRADAVLDVGAHVGYFSLLAAIANPHADVVAVEADPATVEVLRRNVAGRPRVRVVHAALGNLSGEVEVELAQASDNTSLFGHDDSPTVGRVRVPALRGTDLGLPSGGSVAVKIDTEGAELDVLESLEPLLSAAADVTLVVELNVGALRRAGRDPDELLAWLGDHGLAVTGIDERGRRWRRWRGEGHRELMGPAGSLNLYAVGRERALNVVSVLHSASLAGAERSHAEIARGLVDRGVPVQVVLPEEGADRGDDAGLTELLVDGGVAVARVPMAWWIGTEGEPAPAASDVVARTGLADLLAVVDRSSPDVVLTETSVVPAGALVADVLGIPHVWSVREFADLDHRATLPTASAVLGAAMVQASAAVVCNSRAVRDAWFPDPTVRDRVRVVYPSVPAPDPLPEPVGPAGPPFLLGVLARVTAEKGVDDVLAAVARLRGEGVDVAAVLVGAAAPVELGRVRALAESMGVADRVALPGWVADVTEWLDRCDAVVVPSRAEAFGRVTVEATWAGRPVVYAEAAGPAEIMVSGTTGLAYPPGDAEALAVEVRRLMDEPGLGTALATAARAHLAGLLGEVDPVDALLAVLRDAATTLRSRTWWDGYRADIVRELARRAEWTRLSEGAARAAGIDTAALFDPDADAEGARLRLRQEALAHADAEVAARDARLEARRLHDLLDAERAGRVAERAGFETSVSWRLTSPLRAVSRAARARVAGQADEPEPDRAARERATLEQDRAHHFEERMWLAYRIVSGAWPVPYPTAWSEKVWHRRLIDRDPVQRTWSDKVTAREWIEGRIGPGRMAELLDVVDDPRALEWDRLRDVAVKATHGSGGVLLLRDGTPTEDGADPIWFRRTHRPGDVPVDDVVAGFSNLLDRDYGWERLEWAYLGLPRRLVVERLVRAADGRAPVDLKLYVVFGQVRFIGVFVDWFTGARTRFLDPEWCPLPVSDGHPPVDLPRPPRLAEMIEVAEELGRGHDMVRVDLMDLGDGFVVGELTAYPGAGNTRYTPYAGDLLLGSFWPLASAD